MRTENASRHCLCDCCFGQIRPSFSGTTKDYPCDDLLPFGTLHSQSSYTASLQATEEDSRQNDAVVERRGADIYSLKPM
jgi:hypothetical protein